ncbi:hypothetical protein APL41_gp46 [Lactobacillus phage LBR48]|uniref:Uncharacterized protein n=1 Tax=Lactobacillus phage LBR48 TaxID=755164 RepID=D6PSW0_9CAUD|nr:hypothetical protein APL41_gp46 [Lactobacillus phage LBR48]ADF83451.1 hypothetical protein [Lactobacillus phage LBR48]
MAKMITSKFGYTSAAETHCLGDLERDLKTDKRWKERIKHGSDTRHNSESSGKYVDKFGQSARRSDGDHAKGKTL